MSACSFGQLALLIEKLYRASACFSLISKDAMLSRIAVENRVWVPDYDTYVKRMKKREKADAELQAQITAELEAMDKYNEEQLIKKEKAKKISEWESPK